jgi:hypothetical protein
VDWAWACYLDLSGLLIAAWACFLCLGCYSGGLLVAGWCCWIGLAVGLSVKFLLAGLLIEWIGLGLAI